MAEVNKLESLSVETLMSSMESLSLNLSDLISGSDKSTSAESTVGVELSESVSALASASVESTVPGAPVVGAPVVGAPVVDNIVVRQCYKRYRGEWITPIKIRSDINIWLHLNGVSDMREVALSECVVSNCLFEKPDYFDALKRILLRSHSDHFVVVPTTTRQYTIIRKAEDLSDMFSGPFFADIQLSLSGKRDIHGGVLESSDVGLAREVREEIGLNSSSHLICTHEFSRGKNTGNVDMFVSILSAVEPKNELGASVGVASKVVSDKLNKVVSVCVVNDPSVVVGRNRICHDHNNSEGVVVAVIRVRDYIRIMDACMGKRLFMF